MSEFLKAKEIVKGFEAQLSQLVDVLQDMDNHTAPSKLSAEEYIEYDILKGIKDGLDEALADIIYLNKPISHQGTLRMLDSGLYGFNDDFYFTNGDPIEIFIYDDFPDKYVWYSSRIEQNGDDYYAVGYDGPIEGLKARVRGPRKDGQ